MASGADLGDRLNAVVEEYAALDDHRTGTEVDARTVDWFADRLRALGAAVQVLPWALDRYDARWSVRVGGEEVEALPLFYEGTGDVVTGRPATATVRVAGAGAATLPELAAVTARAREEGRPAVVVATGGDTGSLVAVNREIGPATGLPTVCVAGALGPRLVEETVRVEISARLVPGRAANVVGTIGDGPASGSGPGSGAAPGPATLVTTPLSGWFRCAGERGTGIAVALEVARRLAERGPVVVAGTSGHELQGAGQAHLMERLAALAMRPSGVLHVGASAAAGEGEPLRLAATRWAGGWVGADRRGELAAHVERLGARAILPATPEEAGRRESWLGEAQAWSQLGVPLLSIAGAFPLFHTPGDVPAAATTPALLAHVADTLSEMATLLP